MKKIGSREKESESHLLPGNNLEGKAFHVDYIMRSIRGKVLDHRAVAKTANGKEKNKRKSVPQLSIYHVYTVRER